MLAEARQRFSTSPDSVSDRFGKYSPTGEYAAQVQTYLAMDSLPQVPTGGEKHFIMRRRYGKHTQRKVEAEVSNVVGILRKKREDLFIGNRVTDMNAFNAAVLAEWRERSAETSAQLPSDSSGSVDQAFNDWLQTRDEKGIFRRTVQGSRNVAKKVRLQGSLLLMESGLRSEQKLIQIADRGEESESEIKKRKRKLRKAKVREMGPIWFQMQNEIVASAASSTESSSAQPELSRISQHYGVLPQENPFIKDPDLTKKIVKSTTSNTITGRLRNWAGYAAYGALLANQNFREIVDQFGDWKSTGVAMGVTAGAITARYFSEKRALQKEGYTSYLPTTVIYQVLNFINGETDQKKNAALAAKRGVALNTAWPIANPLYWPLIVGKLPYTAVAYVASLTADQLPYIVGNESPGILRAIKKVGTKLKENTPGLKKNNNDTSKLV